MTELKQGLNLTEAKRKLATVQVIKEVNPIEDADAIEVATVKSWSVVVKKGEVTPGQKVIYFEIDSLLPVVPEFEFLDSPRVNPITIGTDNEEVGHRLRTVKLRGQVSQGLIQTFDKVNPVFSNFTKDELIAFMENADEDTDLTELLGVKKWEKPEVSTSLGDSLCDFPSTLTPKTDEPRVQNEPKEVQELKGKSYVGSAKLDGTSTTVIFDPSTKELVFASRNLSLAPGNTLERFLEETGTLDLIKNFDEGVLVLQSELYGEGIQSNRVGIRGKRMATFNIVVDGVRQSLLNSIRIAGKLNLELPDILRLGVTQDEDRELRDLLKTVNKGRSDKNPGKVSRLEGGPLPIKVAANSGVAFDFTVDELVSDVFGEKYPTTGRPLEGIVYRPIAEVDNFNPVSFKVINNKFLIKYDE